MRQILWAHLQILFNFPCISALGRLPTPAPSARKSATRTAQKTALCAPCEHPGGFGIRGSRSRTASPPAPLAILKLRLPAGNPYCRGRRSPPKQEDEKGSAGSGDARHTTLLSADAAVGTQTRC